MRISSLITLFVAINVLLARVAGATAPAPPQTGVARDSLAVRWEEGAELSRWLGAFRADFSAMARVRTGFRADWVTGLSRGRSSEGRLRHDVRWDVTSQRKLSPRFGFWGAATGQHYVDRPREGSSAFAQENRSQLIRVGAGPMVNWNSLLKTHHSAGLVADSRVDQSDFGFGTWNRGAFGWKPSPQSTHEAGAYLEYENPGERIGHDAGISYQLRQDYGAATNQADLAIGWTRRDVLTSSDVPSQLRLERVLRFTDDITYELAQGASIHGSGDLRYLDTRLDDRRGSNSRLEELESGIQAELRLDRRRSNGALLVGVRNATQTVRGEILSGRKTELALKGGTSVASTRFRARIGFSKYTLDTRSEDNFDDRDELAWRFESGITSRINKSLTVDVNALADLNHLVYVFSRNSANNRWTRLLLLSTRFVHRPVHNITHVPEFRISANYQAYDFELNPRQVRSTVFRRLAIGDSVAVGVGDGWIISVRGEVSREELGRLFWEQFEEERSDQTDVVNSSCLVSRELSVHSVAGLGAAYSHRMSDRFEAEGDPRRVLDIESWGPIARLEWADDSWFANMSGQFVMQSELNRDDRSFVSGSITAGRAW